MSFYTSLSGLNGSQSDMSTTSNNIANIGTTGFKRSRAEFGDIFSSSPLQNSNNAIGSGTVLKSIKQQFTQGNIQSSLNALDLAISGQGFFTLKPTLSSTSNMYTRNGSFSVDNDRYVVDSSGQFLQTFAVNIDGSVKDKSVLKPLRLPLTQGSPKGTENVSIGVNLQARSPIIPRSTTFNRAKETTYNSSTSVRVFDSTGNAKIATMYYRKTEGASANNGNVNKWQSYAYVGERKMNPKMQQATDISNNRLYMNKHGQVQKGTDIQKDGGKLATGSHKVYYLYDQTRTAASTPAKILGGRFADSGTERIQITTDPAKFHLTEEGKAAGDPSQNPKLYWGKNFMWARFGDQANSPKSIDVREKAGGYTREELAQELTRSLRTAFGDDRAVVIRPGEKDALDVSFSRSGKNKLPVAIKVRLNEGRTSKEMTQEEVAHLMQDKINRKLMAKDQELRNSGKPGLLVSNFEMDWSNPPVKVVYDKNSRSLKITRRESEFERTGDDGINAFKVSAPANNNLGLHSSNSSQPKKTEILGETIIPTGELHRGLQSAGYGMSVDYDERERRYVFRSGTTGDESNVEVGRYNFTKTVNPAPANIKGEKTATLPANGTVLKVNYQGNVYSIKYKSNNPSQIGKFEVDGPYKNKLKATITADASNRYEFKVTALSDAKVNEEITIADMNDGKAISSLGLGRQADLTVDSRVSDLTGTSNLNDGESRGFKNRGFPRQNIQFKVNFNSETYRVTYTAQSSGAKGTLKVEKSTGRAGDFEDTNDISAKFDANGFFKMETKRYVPGQGLSIPTDDYSEASKLMNNSAKIAGRTMGHEVRGRALSSHPVANAAFQLHSGTNGDGSPKIYNVSFDSSTRIATVRNAAGQATNDVQVRYDVQSQRMIVKATSPITFPKTSPTINAQEANVRQLMGIPSAEGTLDGLSQFRSDWVAPRVIPNSAKPDGVKASIGVTDNNRDAYDKPHIGNSGTRGFTAGAYPRSNVQFESTYNDENYRISYTADSTGAKGTFTVEKENKTGTPPVANGTFSPTSDVTAEFDAKGFFKLESATIAHGKSFALTPQGEAQLAKLTNTSARFDLNTELAETISGTALSSHPTDGSFAVQMRNNSGTLEDYTVTYTASSKTFAVTDSSGNAATGIRFTYNEASKTVYANSASKLVIPISPGGSSQATTLNKYFGGGSAAKTAQGEFISKPSTNPATPAVTASTAMLTSASSLSSKGGFSGNGFPASNVVFQATYGGETYKITYTAGSSGAEGTFAVQKDVSGSWVNNNDLVAAFDSNKKFSLTASSASNGRIDIPAGSSNANQIAASKLFDSIPKITGSTWTPDSSNNGNFTVNVDGTTYTVAKSGGATPSFVVNDSSGRDITASAPFTVTYTPSSSGASTGKTVIESRTQMDPSKMTIGNPSSLTARAILGSSPTAKTAATASSFSWSGVTEVKGKAAAAEQAVTPMAEMVEGASMSKLTTNKTVHFRVRDNWYSATWNAGDENVTVSVLHPSSGANSSDVRVRWIQESGASQGKFVFEANGPITFPVNGHNTGGVQGSTSQATDTKAVLGSSASTTAVMAGNLNSKTTKVDSTAYDGKTFSITYKGQNITVTKSGGANPEFTTTPVASGLRVVWDSSNRQIDVIGDQLMDKSAITIPSDANSQEFFGFSIEEPTDHAMESTFDTGSVTGDINPQTAKVRYPTYKYKVQGKTISDPSSNQTMHVKSGDNWYSIQFNATTKKPLVTVLHPSDASADDIRVRWTETTAGNGRLSIEGKNKITIPALQHSTNGAVGSTSNATPSNTLLGHTGGNTNSIGNLVSDDVDIRELDGQSFKVRYLGQEITVTKSGGAKPTFSTSPQKVGLNITWNAPMGRIEIKSEHLSARESLETIYGEGSEKFLGYLSSDSAPNSSAETIMDNFSVSNTMTTSTSTKVSSGGRGDRYAIDTTKRTSHEDGTNNVLQIGKAHANSIGKVAGKGLESMPAELKSKSAQQDLRSSFNVSTAGGENIVQVTVNGVSARVVIPPKSYNGLQLATEIQRRINLMVDPKSGKPIGGVSVTYNEKDNNLVFKTGTKGSGSQIAISGAAKFGLDGLDVARGKNAERKELQQAATETGSPLYATATGDETTTPPTTPPGDDEWVPVYLRPGQLVFDANGKLMAPLKGVDYNTGGADPIMFNLDMSRETTQRNTPFARNLMQQDGYAEGQLSGLKVDPTGVIRANYSNGNQVALGKLAISNFSNPNGLKQIGNANYTATAKSGKPDVGEAGSGGIGSIRGGSLERSNVDITEELVNLITAQRNFQANAKAIETSSQMTQTIIQIRN